MDGVNVQNVLGQRVRKLRESKKMLQQEVADALHISVSAYAKLESGSRGISSENCIALADLFGVTCDYILRGIDSENIDVCKKTALDQATLDVLIKNKKDAVCAFSEDDFARLSIITDKMDECSDYAVWEQLQSEYDKTEEHVLVTQAIIRDYTISNSLLNWFIRDGVLWEELRRASYQYVTCMEDIFEEYEINDGRPSLEEALNQMGLDAAKYIAGQAFGEFFSRTMKDADFYRAVSNLNDEEINELIKLRFINGDSKKEV